MKPIMMLLARGAPLQLTTAVDSSGPSVPVGTGRPLPLRHPGGDSFEAGNNRLTFVRQGNPVVKLRLDAVIVVSTLERVP